MAASEDSMWWYRAVHDLVAWAVGHFRPQPGPFLDAGCGTGGLLKHLADTGHRQSHIGLDISATALEYARHRAGAGVIAGSVDRLPFADTSLAVVSSIDVLCHGGVDQRRALAEAARCLMPGGILILNLPAYEWLKSTHDVQVHNARRYVRSDVRALIAEAGLIPRLITHWNAILFLPMVLKRKLLASDTSDVKDYPWLLDRLFHGLLALERWLIRRGYRLGFGGSIFAVAEKP